MKPLVIAVIGTVVILGGVTLTQTSTTEYVQPTVVEKEVTIEVETLHKRITDAITASSTDIESKAKQAYEETKAQLQKEVELEVTRTYRKEIEAKEESLEQEVSL